MARDGEVISLQRQHYCHHADPIYHPKSGYVIHQTPRNVNLAAANFVGGSCQSGKMAALLNSLFLVFKISFLPKVGPYRVKYYDYIVKWYGGI